MIHDGMIRKFAVFFVMLIAAGIFSCKKDVKTVTIFHAGSLAVPMQHLKKEFEKRNPAVQVLLESSGSIEAARKISDLHRPCDIMASADYMVIYNILIPEYADFCINFAKNEMAIVYTGASRYAGEINRDNWHGILLRKDVRYGHSDPEKDPCGYRSQLVWQLSETYYREKGLYQKLRMACPKKNVRPKEVDLLALLEAHALDYIFLYKSVAIQHKLPYLELPAEINLGSPEQEKLYAAAQVRISGKKPGEMMTVKGEPMVYGVTLLKSAVNRAGAIAFLEFLLGSEGQEIFKKLGQSPLAPPLTREYDRVPEELRGLVSAVKQ